MNEQGHINRYTRQGGRGKDMLYTVEAVAVAGSISLSCGVFAASVITAMHITLKGYSTETAIMLLLIVSPSVAFVTFAAVMLVAWAVTSAYRRKRRPQPKKVRSHAKPVRINGKIAYYVLSEQEPQ